MRPRLLPPLVLSLALLACSGPPPTKPTTAGTRPAVRQPPAKPSAAGAQGGAGTAPAPTGLARPVGPGDGIARLVGKVRLVPNLDAKLISDRGGSAISAADGSLIGVNGSAVVANNGAKIVSDNGGGLIGNNGSSLVGKVRYGLAQADAATPELPVAGALITVEDAAGNPVLGEDGKPIQAMSDAAGAYRLEARLPAESLVLRVRLWHGGELLALAPQGREPERETPVDTASSLGAGLVLERYVKGNAALLGRLPAAEAERLRRDLDAARALASGTPKYDRAALAAQAETLRALDPALDETVTAIERLFLGQVSLGEGELATSVAIGNPSRVLPEPDGGFLVAERVFGRIRRVGPDGRITTLVDGAVGKIRRTLIGLYDIARASDGTLLASSAADQRIYRIDGAGEVKDALAEPGFAPGAFVEAPDGTFIVAEAPIVLDGPRVLAVPPGGPARELASTADWLRHELIGLARTGDGAVWVLALRKRGRPCALYRLAPGATAWTLVAEPKNYSPNAHVLADGQDAVLVSESVRGRIMRYRADGTSELVAEGPPLVKPGGMARFADGTLLVSDPGAALVVSLAPDGTRRVLAGVPASTSAGTDGVSLNAPGPIALAGDGTMLFVDGGIHAVKRLVGDRLETVAGGGEGQSRDGTLARDARFDIITSMAARGDEIWLADRGSERLQHIGSDGVLRTVIGGTDVRGRFRAVGAVRPATEVRAASVFGLTFDPEGRLVWSTQIENQIRRIEPDGRVRHLAGDLRENAGDAVDEAPVAEARFNRPTALAFGPDGALYVSDCYNMQVRRIVGLDGPDARVERFAGVPRAASLERLGKPGALDPDGTPRLDVALAPVHALCFDAAGNLYVAELGSASLGMLGVIEPAAIDPVLIALPDRPPRIRKITPDGKVSTLCGPGGKYFTDASGSQALVFPSAIAIDRDGRMAIADLGANVIRFLPKGTY